MEEELTFEAYGDGWRTVFVSEGGRAIVQLKRSSSGYLHVYGSIGGMDKAPLESFPYHPTNMMFDVCVPEGVEVTILSGSEVEEALILWE